MVNILERPPLDAATKNPFNIPFDPSWVFAPAGSFPLDVMNISDIAAKANAGRYGSMHEFFSDLESSWGRYQAFFAKRLGLACEIETPELVALGNFTFPEAAEENEDSYDVKTAKKLIDWGKSLEALEKGVVQYVSLHCVLFKVGLTLLLSLPDRQNHHRQHRCRLGDT
jgi:hypothetical protein